MDFNNRFLNLLRLSNKNMKNYPFQILLQRRILLICLAVISINISIAQIRDSSVVNERGTGTLRSRVNDPNKSIRNFALIIGISDYKDPGISDLQFAHKDAQEFYQYLKSPDGGAFLENNIKLLINEQATLAAIDNSLDWCRNTIKKGDKLIIYFAGHGDVEKQTLWQLGYLLAYDTPNGNYRNNATRLEDINNLVKTLTIADSLESKVVVYMDACRSGTLIGSDSRGPALTSEQLSKNVANEVRILSCRPEQNSLEGTAWGGGRGLFSYHLINGLYGAADESKDKIVSLEEIEDYLKKNIKKSIEDQNLSIKQNPLIQGDESFMLSSVSTNSLALVNSNTSSHNNSSSVTQRSADLKNSMGSVSEFRSIKSSLMDSVLFNRDSNTLARLNIAIKKDVISLLHFLYQSVESYKAEKDSFNIRITKEEIDKAINDKAFRQRYCNELAVHIHDVGQNKLTLYLNGDAKELQKRAYYSKSYQDYQLLSQNFQLASTIIDSSHPLYNKLLVKQYYFAGISKRMLSWFDSLQRETYLNAALLLQKKAYSIDDKTPYINNELGNLYTALKDYPNAKKYYKLAIELSPNWFLPYTNLGSMYVNQDSISKAIQLCEKASFLNPKYSISNYILGDAYTKEGKYLFAIEDLNKSILLDSNYFHPYYRLAEINLELTEYAKADELYWKVEPRLMALQSSLGEVLNGNILNQLDVANSIRIDNPFNEISILEDSIKKNPKDIVSLFELGKLYRNINYLDKAERNFLKVFELDPDYPDFYNQYGGLEMDKSDYTQAEFLLNKSVARIQNNWITHLNLASIYIQWNDYLKAEEQFRKVMLMNPSHNLAYFSLFELYMNSKRYADAEILLISLNDKFRFESYMALKEFYIKMLHLNPKDGQWSYKLAHLILKPEYNREANAPKVSTDRLVPVEKSFKSETLLSTKERIANGIQLLKESSALGMDGKDLSQIYIQIGQLSVQNEEYEQAKQYFLQAVKLDSNFISAKKLFIENHINTLDYKKSYQWLGELNDANKLSFDEQKLLARYQIYNGEYNSAEKILSKLISKSLKDNQELYQLFELLYRRSKNYKKAFEYLVLLESYPTDKSIINYEKARIYALQKNQKKALLWAEKAIDAGFNYGKVLKYDPVWNNVTSRIKWHKFLSDKNISTQ